VPEVVGGGMEDPTCQFQRGVWTLSRKTAHRAAAVSAAHMLRMGTT
jgi:hypothetical protein